PQDVVVAALDHVDGVDLHVTEMLDGGPGRRRAGPERLAGVEPLRPQPDPARVGPAESDGAPGTGRQACHSLTVAARADSPGRPTRIVLGLPTVALVICGRLSAGSASVAVSPEPPRRRPTGPAGGTAGRPRRGAPGAPAARPRGRAARCAAPPRPGPGRLPPGCTSRPRPPRPGLPAAAPAPGPARPARAAAPGTGSGTAPRSPPAARGRPGPDAPAAG